MIIEIKIPSIFHRDIPHSNTNLDGDKWEIPEGSTVAQVLKILNLSEEGKVFLINSRQGDKERVLKEGDVLAIFPPIAGG